MTKRELLIGQLREALSQAETPNSDVVFDVLDLSDFSLDSELLDDKINCNQLQ